MSSKNLIGLSADKSAKLAGSLNDLLAHYSVFYQNVRGFHWNIKGDKFFVLHEKFEELYTDLFEKIDEVAERILTLDSTPEHRYTAYQKVSAIAETKETTDATSCVESIVDSFQVLIAKQRSIMDSAAEASDEGTAAMMSDYIREQEKLIWMYNAYLK